MHEEYGPIVRINPDEVHIKDPDYYLVLYEPGSRRDKYKPAAEMIGAPLSTFGSVKHEVHRKRRAANSAFFSKRAINLTEPIIRQEVDLLCENLHKQYVKEEALDMHTVFTAFTTDVLCEYMFGESWGYQNDYAKVEEWTSGLRAEAQSSPLVKQIPWHVRYGLKLPIPLIRPVLPVLALLLEMYKNLRS